LGAYWLGESRTRSRCCGTDDGSQDETAAEAPCWSVTGLAFLLVQTSCNVRAQCRAVERVRAIVSRLARAQTIMADAEFSEVFHRLAKESVDYVREAGFPQQAVDWLTEVLNYNVPGGALLASRADAC
jgi:hypothetical protein